MSLALCATVRTKTGSTIPLVNRSITHTFAGNNGRRRQGYHRPADFDLPSTVISFAILTKTYVGKNRRTASQLRRFPHYYLDSNLEGIWKKFIGRKTFAPFLSTSISSPQRFLAPIERLAIYVIFF
jgi:hypothetical protein